MSKRTEHTFQFNGKQIADAANAEYEYHKGRIAYWQEERTKAIQAAKDKGVEIREYPITGGVRTEMIIDPALNTRMSEATSKVSVHQSSADRFQIESAAYGTQPDRSYELHADDVVYFRLAGGARVE